jgi:hypothetical protein
MGHTGSHQALQPTALASTPQNAAGDSKHWDCEALQPIRVLVIANQPQSDEAGQAHLFMPDGKGNVSLLSSTLNLVNKRSHVVDASWKDSYYALDGDWLAHKISHMPKVDYCSTWSLLCLRLQPSHYCYMQYVPLATLMSSLETTTQGTIKVQPVLLFPDTAMEVSAGGAKTVPLNASQEAIKQAGASMVHENTNAYKLLPEAKGGDRAGSFGTGSRAALPNGKYSQVLQFPGGSDRLLAVWRTHVLTVFKAVREGDSLSFKPEVSWTEDIVGAHFQHVVLLSESHFLVVMNKGQFR